jgi:hypothetical protein
VCDCEFGGRSMTIAQEERYFFLFTRNIWIAEGARCCPEHLVDRRLTTEAANAIRPASIRFEQLSSSDLQLLLNQSQILHERSCKRLDFDDPRGLSNDEYRVLTSLSREDFDDLIKKVSHYGIGNSSNRSIRTAVGIFLCKLRLGILNRTLACLFQLSDKRLVCRIIESVHQAISQDFVPNNLGFKHITRRNVIDHHTTTIARQLLCGGDSDTAILVIDGTYIYIQVRAVHQ